MALSNLPVRREQQDRGFSTTITVGSMSHGEHVQYERDNVLLKAGRRQYGVFNFIHIVNQSNAVIQITPDFAFNKRIIVPAGVIMTKDNISYQEFDIRNIDSTNSVNADELFITFGYEPPLVRDRTPPVGARWKGGR